MLLIKSKILLLAITLLPVVSLAENKLEILNNNRIAINQCIEIYKVTEMIENALLMGIDKELVKKEFENIPNISKDKLSLINNIVDFTYNTKQIGVGQLMLRDCLNGKKLVIV